MFDMIVIGGGPAAIAATFFAHGKALDTVMVCDEFGGKVGWRETLVGPDRDAYLPGNEVVHHLARQIMNEPNLVIHDRVIRVTPSPGGFRLQTRAQARLEARVVVVATGAAAAPLDIPGARGFVDRGLEYSSATYAHLVSGVPVAVIGGTMRALSGAAELAQVAERVYLIAPTISEHGKDLAAVLRTHPRVELLEGYRVTEVLGDDQLTGLVVTHTGHTRQLAVAHAFVNLGLRPNSRVVRNIVDTNRAGFILVNEYYETTAPGLYAAGDVTIRFGEQVLAAVGDGARAALHAYHRLLAQKLLAAGIAAQQMVV